MALCYYRFPFYSFVYVVLFFFFFKQKTSYEMRISDWSSDVCSSDLGRHRVQLRRIILRAEEVHRGPVRRERRRVDVPALGRQPLRRRGIAREQVLDPQRSAGLAALAVEHALGEHQPAPVGRQRRRRIAVEVDHVAHLEAAGGGQRRPGDQRGEREGEMAGFHGDSWIPVQRECFSLPSGGGPCLSPSPSRGRACPRDRT